MKKILVVDDNEILLRAWERILSQEHCQVLTTTNPEEVVHLLEETGGVDLLISDIVMPKMDGFTLAREAHERFRRLKVVLTTGYICDFSNINFDVDLKDLHVVMKPYHNIEELSQFVHRLLDGDDSVNRMEAVPGKNNIQIHLWNL